MIYFDLKSDAEYCSNSLSRKCCQEIKPLQTCELYLLTFPRTICGVSVIRFSLQKTVQVDIYEVLPGHRRSAPHAPGPSSHASNHLCDLILNSDYPKLFHASISNVFLYLQNVASLSMLLFIL